MRKNKGGRPTKEESERLKNKTSVRFTDAEFSFVTAQAGIIRKTKCSCF